MRCVGAELNDPTHLKETEFPSLLDILVYVAPVSIKQYCRYRFFFTSHNWCIFEVFINFVFAFAF